MDAIGVLKNDLRVALPPKAAVALRRRWAIWGIFGAIFVISYFHRVAPGVVAKDLMAAFQASGAILGVLSALYLYIYAAMQIPVGVLADTWGPRSTLALGGVVMASGSLLFGLAGTLGLAYVGRTLVGLGASFIFVCGLRIVATWYRAREFGTLSGLTVTLGSLGGLVATTPLAALVDAVGWRETFVLVAVATFLLAGLGWVVVRDRPSDLGLPSIQAIERSEGLPVADEDRRASVAGVWRGLVKVLKNPGTWAPCFAFFGIYGSLISFTGLWGVPYLRDVYGLSRGAAAWYMMLSALGFGIGSPLAGSLSDRIIGRRRAPYTACFSAYTLLWAVMALAPDGRLPPIALGPLCFLLGLFGGGLIITWAASREVNPPEFAGIATGVANAGGMLGGAIMQGVLGEVLDSGWKGVSVAGARVYPAAAYRLTFWICLGSALAATACTLAVRETYCQNIYAERLSA